MITITAKDAIKALRKLVKVKGGKFRYQPPDDIGTCRYEHDGKPSCGVGWVLHEVFGVPVSVLEGIEFHGIDSVGGVLRDAGFKFDVGALGTLQSFQNVQDAKRYYKFALEYAEAYYLINVVGIPYAPMGESK